MSMTKYFRRDSRRRCDENFDDIRGVSDPRGRARERSLGRRGGSLTPHRAHNSPIRAAQDAAHAGTHDSATAEGNHRLFYE